MATRPKAVIESRNGEKLSPITITKNVLTDNGQNLHDILSDRKEDMMTPTIENSSSMFKVGQGDNVDYSENIVDGAYESCVLKGVTKFIDNNTGETLDSFVENRDLSLIDCKSPILSNTGKNLFNCTNVEDINNSYTVVNMNNQNYITTDTLVEKGKQYTLSLHANISGATGNVLSLGYMNYSNIVGGVEKASHNIVTIDSVVDKTTSITFSAQTTDYIKIYIATGKVGYNAVLSNVQIEEGSVTTSYEPYKSNILSCNGDKIELTEDMFEQGTINETHAPKDYNAIKTQSSGTYFNKRIRLKSPLPIKPNTTYIINVSNNYDVFVGFCLDGVFLDNYIGYKGNVVFTTPSNCNEIALVIKNGNDEDILIANFSIDNIRLSEVDKTIVLRSLPSGVCDTLNVETGEYVQQIGEVVFDGSSDEIIGIGTLVGNTMRFSLRPESKIKTSCDGLCDKFPYIRYNSEDKEHIRVDGTTPYGYINLWINTSRLSTPDRDGLRQWLSQNPVTVQYQLDTPIVSTVDIQGFPYAYTNGHVQLSSGSIEQSLTPKVEYSVVTNRSGQIRNNQKMVERHQKQLDRLQAMILTNLVNTQYEQALTNLKYDLKNVREEVK